MAEERTGWRDDIEGLRAFAIVPVVLFHLDRAYVPGGFLGVDLFLVISGYLIARMLLTGRYLESPSGIRRFLRRRFLRIMPALAVTVALTTLVFRWLAVPTHHTPFYFTGLASLFGASNLQLARLSTDYAPAGLQLLFRRDRPACRVPRAEEDAYRAAVMRGLVELQGRHPTFQVWDPIEAVCPSAVCTHPNGDTLVLSDDNHLSAEMVVALAPSLQLAILRTLATSAPRTRAPGPRPVP